MTTTRPTLTIRPVAPDEHTRVGELTVEAYDATGHPPSDDYAPILRDVASRVAQGAHVLVAEHDGRIVGSVTLTLGDNPYFEYVHGAHGDCGFRMLAVAPEGQGLGVGAALTDHCIAVARRHGCRRMTITSMPWMAKAQAMYRRRGFTRVPELDLTFEIGPGLTFTLPLVDDPPPLRMPPYPFFHHLHDPERDGLPAHEEA